MPRSIIWWRPPPRVPIKMSLVTSGRCVVQRICWVKCKCGGCVLLALHFCDPFAHIPSWMVAPGCHLSLGTPTTPPAPPAASGHSITAVWAFLFNMIHSDHANVLQEKGLNYHAINHTIIRVNDLIVTQNPLFPEGINIASVTFADWGKRK